MIKTFTKGNLNVVREEIEDALEAIGKAHGITIKLGLRIAFTDQTATGQIAMSAIADNGIAMTPEARDFERFAEMMGLQKSDLGRVIKLGSGESYRIVGYRTRAHKQPIAILSCATGKPYRTTIDSIKCAIRNEGVKS